MAHLVNRKQLSLTVLKVQQWHGMTSAPVRVVHPFGSVTPLSAFFESQSIWFARMCSIYSSFLLFCHLLKLHRFSLHLLHPEPARFSRRPWVRENWSLAERLEQLIPQPLCQYLSLTTDACIYVLCVGPAIQTVEVQDLSPSGLLLMRVFFHEIIAAGDDASFMEV